VTSSSQLTHTPIMPPRYQLLSGRLNTPQTFLRAAQSSRRTYATSDDPEPIVKNPLRRRKGGDLGSHLPKHVIPPDAYIPAYPYGDHTLFKQANNGLYGEQMIQFGNNVSHKTETKTRRYWKPNILNKSLYSVALKKRIKLRITSKVLKTMDREGGLDEYLLKDNEHRLKELGPLGWALRWTLLQRPEVIERMRTQAAALGLSQAAIDAQWPTRQLLSLQKNHIRAADLVSDAFDEPDSALDIEDDETPTDPDVYTREDKRALFSAGKEFDKALKAATRYLARGNVDSEEAGLKLAFIRARERKLAADRLRTAFAAKLDAQFSPADVLAARSRLSLGAEVSDADVKEAAYKEWRRAQVEQFGGDWQAWRDALNADKLAKYESSDPEAKKVEYANAIAEAETAATNEALDEKRREYLLRAMEKADRAIRARAGGGREEYAERTLEEGRRVQVRGEKREVKVKEGDAWAAVVEQSNAGAARRVEA
jgi:large subunit ribosomal protein L28